MARPVFNWLTMTGIKRTRISEWRAAAAEGEQDVRGEPVWRNSDAEFRRQLQGYGLSTVEISYYMPDHPTLLQLFIWQHYDVAPQFPVLRDFLDHWRREVEAALHSVRVAHNHLIGPAEWRAVDGVITIN
jgi:uncharacterized protein Usg